MGDSEDDTVHYEVSDTVPYNPMSRENNIIIKDDVLRHVKRYFALTGQYWSFEISQNSRRAKRILYGLLQFMIACFASFYFVYTFGVFGSNEKPYGLIYRYIYYPVTTIENQLWEFRWLITCLLGILLTRGIWLETFEKNINNIYLGENRWEKVKNFSWILGFALIVMWAATVIQTLVEINFKINRFNALAISLDFLFSLIDRVLAFPLFFLFCVTMYILCCMVEQYRDDIEKWEKEDEGESTSDGEAKDENLTKEPVGGEGETSTKEQVKTKGENSARERFRKIKAAIRITGLSFESYLMVHFMLLLCTFFLGVCASFEQMEVRVAENYTMALPFQMPNHARFINFYGNLTYDTDMYTIGEPVTKSASMLKPSHKTLFTQTEGKDAVTGVNMTRETQTDDLIRTKWLKRSMKSVAICMLVRTLESLFLYLLPISLMVRLQNRLRRVYEVIEDSNVEEQKGGKFLFDNVEVIRRMCKYVKTAHGLKIFGHTVPTFQAYILAAFGPFITVVVQQLLLHIHMKQG